MVQLESTSSQFQVDMNLYTDANLTEPMGVGHQVMVPDPIYAEIVAEDEGLNVQLRNCWASNCETLESGCLKYHFIENFGAIVDDMMITKNCDASIASFWIDAFTFNAAQNSDVYLMCDVHMCMPTEANDYCACPNEIARKRRSTENDHALLKLGPINIIN